MKKEASVSERKCKFCEETYYRNLYYVPEDQLSATLLVISRSLWSLHVKLRSFSDT